MDIHHNWRMSGTGECRVDIRHETKQKLRSIINCFKSFDDVDRCVDYITDLKCEQVVLIIDDQLGKEFIPLIHDLTPLTAIYIKAIITNTDDLINKIFINQKERQHMINTETPIPISTFNPDDTNIDLATENGNFMWFQLFIGILMSMERPSSPTRLVQKCAQHHGILLSDAANIILGNVIKMDRDIVDKLIGVIKQEYVGNTTQLKLIDEFSETRHATVT
ncbi:unnamed protein product, partial [Didymodactylos carnosus]